MNYDRKLLVALGVTGAAALALEIIWSRALIPWVGGTAMAQIATVGVYMLGLFAGSWVASMIVENLRNPRQFFFRVEASAALVSLLMILSLPLMDPIFRLLTRGELLSGSLGAGLRGLAGGILIFPATFLMGLGFPAAISAYRKHKKSSSAAAWVYGINTAGAAVGALAGGFVLVPYFGLLWAPFAVVALDLAFLFWASKENQLDPYSENRIPDLENLSPSQSAYQNRTTKTLEEYGMLASVILGGFVALGLEIILFRALGLMLGPTARAFSVVVTTYVLGLGIGSLAAGRIVQKGPRASRILFVSSWLMTGVLVLFIQTNLNLLPEPFSRLMADKDFSFGQQFWIKGLIAGVILLPLTSSFGAAYAAAVGAAENGSAKRAGRLYAALTLGNIAGLFVTAIWILPGMGLEKGLLLFAGMGFLVPLFSFAGSEFRTSSRVMIALLLLALAALGPRSLRSWNWKVMLSAPYMYGDARLRSSKRLVSMESGFETTVAVFKKNDQLFFTLDGKTDGGNSLEDMKTQSLAGALAAALHPQAKKCLVIGLGTGQTVSEILRFPVESVSCSEIVPAVTRTLKFFETINRSFWLDPRYHHIQADGRTVMRYGGKKYDLIVSEPSNLWVPGVAHLFTREAFFEARMALQEPGGLFLQWIHGYRLDPKAFKMVVRTFLDVFPHVTLWGLGPDVSNLFLIGSLEPLRIDGPSVRTRLKEANLENYMAPGRKLDEISLLGTFIAGIDKLNNLAKDSAVIRDHQPYLEYIAERSIQFGTRASFIKMLAEIQEPVLSHLASPSKKLKRKLSARSNAFRAYQRLVTSGAASPEKQIYDLQVLSERFPRILELQWTIAGDALRLSQQTKKMGFPRQSNKILRSALSFWPDQPDVLAELVVRATARRDYSDAVKILDKMDRVALGGTRHLMLRSQVLMAEGKPQDALPIIRNILILDPGSLMAHWNMGLSLQRLGRTQEARAAFEKVVELDPWNERARSRLARLSTIK